MKPLPLAAICFLLVTCVTPYEPSIEGHTQKLVVDGLVTNQYGPHRVTLAYSTPYINEKVFPRRFISNAIVRVEDNDGVSTNLQYFQNGIYETPSNFIGHTGKHYTLKITLANGSEYHSMPEEMKFVPPIDTITGEYRELPGPIRGEFKLSVETKDPSSKEDFYHFRWVHYEFKPYCSIVFDTHSRTTNVVECCEDCWAIDQCPECINVLSDEVVNGSPMKVPIVTIPYDTKDPYFIVAEQRSLTEAAYKFWKSASTQINSSGGIFDSPPVTIPGNVFNVNDPQEQVLGFFGASSVASKSIYFKRDKVGKIPYSFKKPDLYVLNVPCIPCSVGALRTIKTPPGW